MQVSSHTRALVEIRLGGHDLADWVRERRRSGHSWRAIEVALTNVTGIFVSRETLRTWFPDEPRKEASA